MKVEQQHEVNATGLRELRQLIAAGEGLHLEFKLKATHPDKIVREMLAFANTAGGTLLVGVEDDGRIQGLKYPEEELLVIQQEARHCKPALNFVHRFISVNNKRSVLELQVPLSPRRPHYYIVRGSAPACFVRSRDMSLRASREMAEIVRRAKKEKDTRFHYGEAEQKLMAYLGMNPHITLDQFRALARLSRFQASRKLILLVLARVLQILPTEKGDLYLPR